MYIVPPKIQDNYSKALLVAMGDQDLLVAMNDMNVVQIFRGDNIHTLITSPLLSCWLCGVVCLLSSLDLIGLLVMGIIATHCMILLLEAANHL